MIGFILPACAPIIRRRILLHIGIVWSTPAPILRRRGRPKLHIWIVWSTPALWRHPDDILRRVLDVAGLAVHAVLRVDLQAVAGVVVFHEFVYARRTVTIFRPGIGGEIDLYRYARVLQREMDRLVFFVIGVGNEYRRQPVETDLAVRFRILNRRAFRG